MWPKRSLRSLGRIWKDFVRNEGGNFAFVLALSVVPVTVAAGGAVDYYRQTLDRTLLQSALDTTALILAKEYSASITTSNGLTQRGQAVFDQNYRQSDVTTDPVKVTLTSGSTQTLTVSTAGSLKASFLKIAGISELKIDAASTATWGNSRLRVALVLDNTGSMAQSGKMTALKSATTKLLTQLKASANTDGDVYVSIIPFVKDVNLGAANYTASWIDWTEWDDENGTCTGGGRWGNGSTKSTCTGTWTPKAHSTWNGCVVDRGNSTGPASGNYDTNATAPTTAIPATLYAAEQYSSCPQAAMGLTYDWTALNTLVTNMVSSGNTNQGIGLQIGWLSLVGGGPFKMPAKDPNYTYQDVVILLTDGLNTQNRWYSSQSSIDAREKLTCTNIKASGVDVYTVQVNTGSDPTSTLLRDCASSTSKFFLLKSANDMVSTFETIGTQLSRLRLAK